MDGMDSGDESFVIDAARRVREEDPSRVYALARDAVELCVGVADLGGTLPRCWKGQATLDLWKSHTASLRRGSTRGARTLPFGECARAKLGQATKFGLGLVSWTRW